MKASGEIITQTNCSANCDGCLQQLHGVMTDYYQTFQVCSLLCFSSTLIIWPNRPAFLAPSWWRNRLFRSAVDLVNTVLSWLIEMTNKHSLARFTRISWWHDMHLKPLSHEDASQALGIFLGFTWHEGTTRTLNAQWTNVKMLGTLEKLIWGSFVQPTETPKCSFYCDVKRETAANPHIGIAMINGLLDLFWTKIQSIDRLINRLGTLRLQVLTA